MTDSKARTWRHYVVYFLLGTPALVGGRMLWRGVPKTADAWIDNVQHALLFTIPYMLMQALVDLLRHRALKRATQMQRPIS
jgi:hypothetical protein